MTTAQRLGLKVLHDAFHDRGYVVLRDVVDDHQVADLRDRLELLLGPVPARAPAQEVTPRLVEHDPMFAALATSTAMLATVEEIFGATPLLACSYGHRKAPRTPAHTGPHSDVAHLRGVPHPLSLLMVKAMVALTAVGPDNGPTMLFPGTHHGGEAGEGVEVLLEPGDMVLFHANIRHTATANSSAASRLGLWFVYARPWMRIFPGYDFSPDFLVSQEARIVADPRLRHVFGLSDAYAT